MEYIYYQKHMRSRRGFTLVEMLVVIGLTTLIALVIANSITSFYQFNGYVIAQSYQVSYARDGMDQMIRDLREMTFADDGAFPLVFMGTTSIHFYSDIDRDDSVEFVKYILGTTTLAKYVFSATGTPLEYSTTSESSAIVSEYVQNRLQNIPVFMYYDGNGNPATGTTTNTDIRYIRVNLIINVDPVRDPGEFLLQSSASLRNLKSR